jgi:hypothetical protein
MSATTPQPSVEIVVDELVLRGVAPEQAGAVVAALQGQLGVLGERWATPGRGGLATRAEAVRRVPAVDVPAASPAMLGSAIAGAVVGGLTGARR